MRGSLPAHARAPTLPPPTAHHQAAFDALLVCQKSDLMALIPLTAQRVSDLAAAHSAAARRAAELRAAGAAAARVLAVFVEVNRSSAEELEAAEPQLAALVSYDSCKQREPGTAPACARCMLSHGRGAPAGAGWEASKLKIPPHTHISMPSGPGQARTRRP